MIERATDAILLKRFAEGREESAFAELVDRHGPRVQRECRRFLRSEHDVEDVFQATFLLLALRASDVAWRASIGGWVRDAARRLALHARSEIARRGRRETPASCLPGFPVESVNPACPASIFTEEVERREVRGAIDRAVEDLPEKYRDPLVLCYLQGKTNHEAAAELGYPVGSISRRLDRARGMLRTRLIGRGVTLGLLLALAAWAALAPHRRTERSGAGLDPVPSLQAVATDVPSSNPTELGELLAALERNDLKGLDRSRLDLADDHAQSFSGLVPKARPGLAGETRLAALELAGLAPFGDRAAAAKAAASRLLATCVQCHVALH